jgi:adenylate cyclase class 1
VENKVAQLYVTDGNGALFHVRAPFHTDATLVHQLRTFFESVQYRQSVHAKDVDIKPPVSVTFDRITRSADREFHQKPVDVDMGTSSNTGFDIQVIGEQIDGTTQFTLFCDGEEFSALEHGDSVFEALARHIVGKRQGGGRYPIFITDIDLSRMSERSGSLPTLQTIHYLHYKKRIEERLNAAIPRVST